MGLLHPPLSVLLLYLLLSISLLTAQPSTTSRSSARSLDVTLQDYAYRAFVRTRTGVQYNADTPDGLSGIKVSGIRLRSGSLFIHGVAQYNEFDIPMGVYEQPYVERLVLVYQNLGNWSSVYYPIKGYTYLAPVLGLLAYDAANLSATNLPTLDIKAVYKPISIKFNDVKRVPDGLIGKCIWFNLDGLPEFSNVSNGNVCETFQQGHFSIVVENEILAPFPAPAPEMAAPPPPKEEPSAGGGGTKHEQKDNWKVWKIVLIVVGSFLVLLLLSMLIIGGRRYKRKKKMKRMEKASDVGEALKITSVGNARAPVAMVTRTQPVLENEYVP